ncbi:hypothetical protein OIO90_001793 [Microbotryomycetes sp. JL221]|nr:hypothetical protein OIO90_001793 [Microbotryomycetes sp. JL221]
MTNTSNETNTSLPIIDISSFLNPRGLSDKDDKGQRQRVARKVHSACVNQGFFYVTGFDNVVSRQEMIDILQITREFFNSPEHEKRSVAIRKGDAARGWQQLGKNVTQGYADHHEGYDLYRPVDNEDPSKLLHGSNPWPNNPPAFRPKLEAWIEKMSILGRALMECTAMGLGIEPGSNEFNRLMAQTDKSFWVQRCIGYPPLPQDNGKGISCGQHYDYGCFTLLHADDTRNALQVFLRDDEQGQDLENNTRGHWINADPLPDCLVVNIGEMWEIWSNQLYKATLHRVIHKGSSYRVSIPFFYEPNFDALIEPLPSALKQTGGQPKQKSVVYGEHLARKVSGNFL